MTTPDAHYRRGLALFGAQDHLAAIDAYTAALRLRPGFADAFSNRGAARSALGDRRGALADYDAALALDPGLAAALNNRAAARVQVGDLDGALADLRAAVALDPSSAVAYENCAAVHDNLVQHAQAVACYDRAVALYAAEPRLRARLASTLVRRSLAHYHLRRGVEALADVRAAYRAAPRVCAAAVAGTLVRDARTPVPDGTPDAVARCDRHLARDPADLFTLVRRAMTHLARGDRAAFAADYATARLAPGAAADVGMAEAFFAAVEHRLASLETVTWSPP